MSKQFHNKIQLFLINNWISRYCSRIQRHCRKVLYNRPGLYRRLFSTKTHTITSSCIPREDVSLQDIYLNHHTKLNTITLLNVTFVHNAHILFNYARRVSVVNDAWKLDTFICASIETTAKQICQWRQSLVAHMRLATDVFLKQNGPIQAAYFSVTCFLSGWIVNFDHIYLYNKINFTGEIAFLMHRQTLCTIMV